MQKLSNIKILPFLVQFLILLLLAKFIALCIWWFLPSEGVELNAHKSYQAKYQRVDFKNMLTHAKVDANPKSQKVQVSSYNISSLILKGLYGSKFHGFAIVAKKSMPKKTTILSVGEKYRGYKLHEIALTHVIFIKANKEYVLSLAEQNKSKFSNAIRKVNGTKKKDTDTRSISKQDIKNYSKNPSQIWKDIEIKPTKQNGKITGFKINRIKAGSKMATLGLQKGDIIIRANNINLTSFNDAIKLYNDRNNLDAIDLIVLRDNQEKEIIYEIH